MRIKQILKKVCVISALSIAAGSIFYLANSASNAIKIKNNLILSHHVNHKNKHNISGKHIIIYLKPDFQSKKIQTVYDHLQLESIIPFYETDNWVKIGNSNNGKVGWINKHQLDKFYRHLQKHKIIEKHYRGEPKVTYRESPDGRYSVRETNGIKDGIRFRITEERYVIEGNNMSMATAQDYSPMYEDDISEEEMQSAMDELEYISKYE